MKTLTFLLVLINVLFFAYIRGQNGDSSPDAQRVKQQVSPELIEILPSVKPLSEWGQTCRAWAMPSQGTATKVALVASKVTGQEDLQRNITPIASAQWWVMIPPQPSAQAADKKGGQLKDLGVSQFSIVTEGAQKNALSLGLFNSEAESMAHLTTLKNAGVRSAVISKLAANSTFLLQVRASDSVLDKIQSELNSQQPDLQPRPCVASN